MHGKLELPLGSTAIGAVSNVAAGELIHQIGKEDSALYKGMARTTAGIIAPGIDHALINENSDVTSMAVGMGAGAGVNILTGMLADHLTSRRTTTSSKKGKNKKSKKGKNKKSKKGKNKKSK